MYLLRFFFRSFSLCYLLSCGILLMILVNYIAYGDGSPPAKFTRIIFCIPLAFKPLASPSCSKFTNLFRSASLFFRSLCFLFYYSRFFCFVFQLARIVALVARIIKFPRSSPIDAAKIIYPKVPIPML